MYKLITVGGADATSFLQGQLSQDVSLLTEGGSLPAAWCNPKGRVIVVLKLIGLADAVGLLVPASMADSLTERLTMFRFRSKVDFQVNPAPPALIDDEEVDIAALIQAGRPFIDETNSEKFTPHMLNLDKLGAISFKKGCYTGQEVVARTENLGKSKRRLSRYSSHAHDIVVGDKLNVDDRPVGEVVNVSGTSLLAVTPVALHDQVLSAGNSRVNPEGLPYEI